MFTYYCFFFSIFLSLIPNLYHGFLPTPCLSLLLGSSPLPRFITTFFPLLGCFSSPSSTQSSSLCFTVAIPTFTIQISLNYSRFSNYDYTLFTGAGRVLLHDVVNIVHNCVLNLKKCLLLKSNKKWMIFFFSWFDWKSKGNDKNIMQGN